MRKNTQELAKAEIMFLDKKLPKAGEDAMRFLADPFGFAICAKKQGKRAEKKNTYWCADCGAEFPLDEVKDYRIDPEFVARYKDSLEYKYLHYRTHIGTCPHCGKPMKIYDLSYNKTKLEDIIAVRATFGDWQIVRYYDEILHCKVGRQAEVELKEIGADWTRDGKTYHYIARMGGMFYSKYWKEETRHFATRPIEHSALWDESEDYGEPSFSLDEELAKRGIDTNALHGLKLTQILSYMEEDAHFETLWKQGDFEIAKFFRRELCRYWSEIRIARKNGYTIDNLTEWKDMVDLLRALNKDTHNRKYICPANLHEAHQAVLTENNRRIMAENERRRRALDMLDREHAEQMMKVREETEKRFIKRRERFFGLSIAGNGFTIICLKSIDDFENEGEMLHHCVFRCGYYDKANSLILSARDSDNNPIETLEIDLQSFKILQCYGSSDTHTALHGDIVNIMNENMWRVKEICRGKNTKAA